MRQKFVVVGFAVYDITIRIDLVSESGFKTVLEFKDDSLIPLEDKYKKFIFHLHLLTQSGVMVGIEHLCNSFKREREGASCSCSGLLSE